MQRTAFGLVLLFILGCSGVLGSPLEQMEGSFQGRMESLEELAAETEDPALRARVEASIATHRAAYGALPTDPAAREEALGALNMASRADIDAFTEADDVEQERTRNAAEAQMAETRSTWDGKWIAPGYVLEIGSNDQVHYENNAGGMEKTLDLPIASLTPEALVLGFMGITTTFRIDQPPTETDGVWTLQLDGIAYTRQ